MRPACRNAQAELRRPGIFKWLVKSKSRVQALSPVLVYADYRNVGLLRVDGGTRDYDGVAAAVAVLPPWQRHEAMQACFLSFIKVLCASRHCVALPVLDSTCCFLETAQLRDVEHCNVESLMSRDMLKHAACGWRDCTT
jgi:hypothetical protein